ncbi:hypothetical protein Zm00014a_001725 [Zea mays]|uniref:Myb/SANT-like domain-containing protein n=1 Tax=Zea mays TaxID=4577 RepID=A0A3L6DCZ7_MAIZE|nr:hypothetical protein Zm00014a_001725 [Zea mays]
MGRSGRNKRGLSLGRFRYWLPVVAMVGHSRRDANISRSVSEWGKKSGCSTRVVKQRADWNPGLERSLVNILHEFKDSDYRGDNGWNSEGWNRMVKEFHVRNKYVSFTKARIQDKEGQLKRVYKMLKAARQHSGSSWNEKRNLVEGPPTLWENLMVKFNNNKATFPLFDDLGEPYDRHLAEGTWSCTSLEAPQEEELNEQLQDAEDGP